MFWRQKAQLLGATQARTDQLQTLITNYLAGKNTTFVDINQSTTSTAQPSLIVQVGYNSKVDADQVWSDIQNANTSGWIIHPSWAAYAAHNDDGTSNQLLGRIDW